MFQVDPRFYWNMPSAKAFLDQVATELGSKSVCVIDLAAMVPVNFVTTAVADRCEQVKLGNSAFFELDGQNSPLSCLSAYYGISHLSISHFNSANELKDVVVFFIAKSQSTLLQAVNFCNVLYGTLQDHCPLRVVIINAGKEHHVVDHRYREFPFNCSLKRQEVRAYLLMRSSETEIHDPSGAYKEMIVELSRFDPGFVEQLLQYDSKELLCNARGVLKKISSVDSYKCQRANVHMGMLSTIDSKERHILHDFYLSENGQELQQLEATLAIKNLIWKALLTSLLPWMEFHRIDILAVFRDDLSKLADGDGKVLVGNPESYEERRELFNLEINHLAGLLRSKQIAPPAVGTLKFRAAGLVDTMKNIRNELAHQGIPHPDHVKSLLINLPPFVDEYFASVKAPS